MKSRLELHEELKALLGSGFVYFQPPESVRMNYPCIVYSLADIDLIHADNKPYIQQKKYSIIVIAKDPDFDVPDRIANLPLCKFDRSYTSNNLNHWVFSLFY